MVHMGIYSFGTLGSVRGARQPNPQRVDATVPTKPDNRSNKDLAIVVPLIILMRGQVKSKTKVHCLGGPLDGQTLATVKDGEHWVIDGRCGSYNAILLQEPNAKGEQQWRVVLVHTSLKLKSISRERLVENSVPIK